MFLHPVNHNFLYKAWYNLETTTEITIIFPSNPVKWLSPATTWGFLHPKKKGLLHGLHSAAQTFVLLAPELFFFGLAGFPMMGMWFFSAKMEKRWEKMDSLKTYVVCVKPCTVFFPFMENGVLQKISQKLLATYQRCRPAVPTDACIRCNFDSDAPISRESLLEGRRRPENSVKFGGDTMTWLRIIRVLKQHTCGFDSSQWPKSAVIPKRLVHRIPMDYDNPQYIW